MRKILENKWVAAALVVLALGVLGWTFRGQWAGVEVANARGAEQGAETSAAEDPTSKASVLAQDNFISMIVNRWIPSSEITALKQNAGESTPRRDPFVLPPREILDPSNPSGDTNAAAGPPALELQAISMNGDKGLAVINRVVVGKGDQLQGYSVQQVLSDQVVVSGYGERRILRLDFSGSGGNSSSEPDASKAPEPANPVDNKKP